MKAEIRGELDRRRTVATTGVANGGEGIRAVAFGVTGALLTALLVLWPAAHARAAFPGRNGRIAFVGALPIGTGKGGPTPIFTMNPDGTGWRGVALGLDPAFSPSGRKIAFDSYAPTAQTGIPTVGIYLANANGTHHTRFLAQGIDPSFSPSGKRIAFVRAVNGGNNEIFRINVDGSHLMRLTRTDDSEGQPAFSEKGKIAFTRILKQGDGYADGGDIWIMRADGSHEHQLTADAPGDPAFDSDPAFSPRGKRIVFASSRDDGLGLNEVYVMNEDGSHQHRLTNNPADDRFPVFSPNGKKIAFTSTRFNGPNTEILKMNVDGSAQHRLTYSLNARLPDWGVRPPPRHR